MVKNENLLILILATIQFTHIIDFMIMMPLGKEFMVLFDISPQQFTFLVSGYAFAAFLAGLLSALFIDGFDRRHALLVLYVGFIAGTLACAVASSYHFFFCVCTSIKHKYTSPIPSNRQRCVNCAKRLCW